MATKEAVVEHVQKPYFFFLEKRKSQACQKEKLRCMMNGD